NAFDVIVVGHRGRWGLSEILLGSVSNYVFHHAHCPVLVVPTPGV
ncbi:MAG: universal stress protein, partial [Microcystaceae cyanobacterium]